jgi:hypothetical protein
MPTQPLPFFYIGKDLTDDRINDYVSNKHNLLSSAMNKQDTKSIWYSKEHIEKLLAEIEHYEGDGLRVSLGTYETGNEFAGQTCLVMNVTRELIIGDLIKHTNVNLETEPDFEDRSALSRKLNGDDPLFGDRDFNYGSPCPPRCD